MRKKILILDDDADVLDILQIILDYEGLEAIIVEKTNDLFSLVRVYQPTLILLDYCLGGQKTGGDWCTQLKNDEEFAAIPVIIFTASCKAMEKGSYGCDDFIAKPFSIAEIVTSIKTLTDNLPECLYCQKH